MAWTAQAFIPGHTGIVRGLQWSYNQILFTLS